MRKFGFDEEIAEIYIVKTDEDTYTVGFCGVESIKYVTSYHGDHEIGWFHVERKDNGTIALQERHVLEVAYVEKREA